MALSRLRDLRRMSALLVLAAAAFVFGGCASPTPARKPLHPDQASLSRTAHATFARGDAANAIRLYRRALTLARAADDTPGIAACAFNLGACLLVAGEFDAAWIALEEARAAFVRAEWNLADLLLLQAKAARARKRLTEATDLAGQVLAAAQSTPAQQLAARVLQAHLLLDAGQPAEEALATVQTLAQSVADPLARAEVDDLEGRATLLQNDATGAAVCFDRAAGRLQEGGRFREMAMALRQAAEAWLRADRPEEAGERGYRAARALLAQGDYLGAEQGLAVADEAADRYVDAGLRLRISALSVEILAAQKASQPASDDAPTPAVNE